MDHGVPGAASQVGPWGSQLYPLPMTFVFLILCLLIFFNTKKKTENRTLWSEDWGLGEGRSSWEVWPRFLEACSESKRFPSSSSPHPFHLRGLAEPPKSPSSYPALTSNMTSAVFVQGKRNEKQPVAKGLNKLHRGW